MDSKNSNNDIEKRIELKNLEIKKMRLEQELINLSNDSYQQPPTPIENKIVDKKSTTTPNNNILNAEDILQFKKAVVLLIPGLLLTFFYFVCNSSEKSTPSSNSSSSNNRYISKTCKLCGKDYSNLGWFNLYNQSHQANEGGMQHYCSYTCASKALNELNRSY